MSPDRKKPGLIRFSSTAAAQIRSLTGEEPLGEVDPTLEVPSVATKLTPWESNKFGRLIGQTPSSFTINPNGGRNEFVSIGIQFEQDHLNLLRAQIYGIELTTEQLALSEYLPVDIHGRELSLVQESEYGGIDLILGKAKDPLFINSPIWVWSSLKPDVVN